MAEVEAQAILNGDSKQEEPSQPEIAADKLPAQDEKPVDPSTGDTIKETATDKASQKVEKPTEQAPRKIEKPMSAHQLANGQRRSNGANQGKRYNERPQRGGKRFDKNVDSRGNNKFQPNLPESDDPIAIRKQVEFYFSESNLLTDKFLFSKIEGHENVPVPIDIIHSFKRMCHFKPRSAIVAALKESKTLDIVNDDNDIQRKEPLEEGLVGKPMEEVLQVHETQSMAQSVYAKGFGDEEASTQFDVEAFFATYGSTNSVRLRRDVEGTFKGSVFVEFENEDTANNFLAIDPPPMYKGNILQLKSKKQYCDEKVEDIKAGRVRPNSPGIRNDRGHRNNHERGGSGDKDQRDWKARRNDDAKEGFPELRHDNRNNRGGNRGRGGRGFGRGGGGGRGRGRGGSRGDDRKERDRRSPSKVKGQAEETAAPEAKAEEVAAESSKQDAETAADSAPAEVSVAQSDAEATSKKRGREDDDEVEGERQVKKADTKEA